MHTLRTENTRIAVVFAILLAVAAWQFDFVVTAIGSNVILNSVIIGTFVFGLSLIVMLMRTLRNEYFALFALYEMYDDVRYEEETNNLDPMWRYYRCAKVGLIYREPRILGQAHALLREQLQTNHSLTVSASTMQTIVADIDQRLAESRSLIGYIAGVLIFLGLIGTFIGLMVTLASVGQILGDLDLTGADPTATVAALMANLQTPLKGMATGFSSSLFGLVTSLTMSVMIQMLSRAGRALRTDFSGWLSTAVEIGDNQDGAPGEGSDRGAIIEERRLALLMKTARYAVSSQQRQARAIEALTEKVGDVAVAQKQTEDGVNRVADAALVLAEQHKVLHRAVARNIEALKAISSSHDVRDDVAELTAMISVGIETRDSRLAEALGNIQQELSALGQLPSSALDEEGDELARELAAHTDELNVEQLNKLLGMVYSRETPGPKVDAPEDDTTPATGTGQGS